MLNRIYPKKASSSSSFTLFSEVGAMMLLTKIFGARVLLIGLGFVLTEVVTWFSLLRVKIIL